MNVTLRREEARRKGENWSLWWVLSSVRVDWNSDTPSNFVCLGGIKTRVAQKTQTIPWHKVKMIFAGSEHTIKQPSSTISSVQHRVLFMLCLVSLADFLYQSLNLSWKFYWPVTFLHNVSLFTQQYIVYNKSLVVFRHFITAYLDIILLSVVSQVLTLCSVNFAGWPTLPGVSNIVF